MEGILIKEEVILPGNKFDYNIKEIEFLGFKYKEKENYKELIIRLSKDFLKKRDVINTK